MCVLMEQCVENVCINRSNIKDEHVEFGSTNTKLESQQLVKACKTVVEISQHLDADNNMATITHKVYLHTIRTTTLLLRSVNEFRILNFE